MSPGKIARLALPVVLLVGGFEAIHHLPWRDWTHDLDRWLTPWDHERCFFLAAAALALVLASLRFGRLELALIVTAPLALGATVLVAITRTFNLVLSPIGDGVPYELFGAVLAFVHADLLASWYLGAWRRQERATPYPTLASGLCVAVGIKILCWRSELLTVYATLAGLAQIFVPRGMQLLLRLRGTNGTPPSLRGIYGGLWILAVMASRGLWFLLTAYPRLKGEARQRAAIEAIRRISRKVVADSPCGPQVQVCPEGAFATPGVVVANHVSMFDITSILALDLPAVIFVKGWVLKTPVMGHMARAAGYLDVEALGAGETLERARAAFDAGLSVLVFPEGTRARDGYPLARFRNGAFALARQLGVPVTPVVIAGSVNVVRAKTWWLGRFESRTEVLPPLDPAEFQGELADKRMAQAARERIQEAFWRLWPLTQQCDGWDFPLAGMYRYLGATVGHYAASKFKRDPLLKALPGLCPGEGPVLHAGCGLALASARLALYDPRRPIRGVDLDPRKIELARAALGETTGARFELGDLRELDLGQPELILLIDVLHYWPGEVQDALLARLAAALAPGGRLVFRDGVAGAAGHRWVALGERLATGGGFTRAGRGLHFDSEQALRDRLERAGFALRSEHPELGLGSNLVLVCEKAERPSGTQAE